MWVDVLAMNSMPTDLAPWTKANSSGDDAEYFKALGLVGSGSAMQV
jgi:hypothetical protein